MTAQPVPEWLRPDGGLTADDLDRLPDLPDHTELIDGGLVFVSPQRLFHLLVIKLLEAGLQAARPDDVRVRSAMTVTLDRRTRVEPDVLLVRAEAEPSTAGVYAPTGVHHDKLSSTVPFPIDIKLDLSGL